MLIQREIF